MSGLSFRSWMKAARKQAGLGQAELGRRCNPPVGAGRIGDIERGRKTASLDEVARIRAALKARSGNG